MVLQTVKHALRSANMSGESLEKSLVTFLLRYRTTPHAMMGVAPCTLFCNRMLHTRLDLITTRLRSM